MVAVAVVLTFRLTTHFRPAHQAIEVDETAMTRGAGDDRTHLAAGYSTLASRSDHASGTPSVSRNDVRVRPDGEAKLQQGTV